MDDDPTMQIQQAYADTRHSPFNDGDRCLQFVTSRWLTPDEAADTLAIIGRYNAFRPMSVGNTLRSIEDVDEDALVAVAREGSPALYVETDDGEAVAEVFGGMERYPDELSVKSPDGVDGEDTRVGSSLAREERYAHTSCAHDEPPVPVEEWPVPDPDRDVVRAWWD